MARIQLGGTATGIRGTIGGVIYSENAAGLYARAWSQGPKRQSSVQQWYRAIFSQGQSIWSALSDAERLNWKTFAAAPTELDYDPWGVQFFLHSNQWYLRAQSRRVYAGLPVDVTCPSAPAPAVPASPVLDLFTPTFGTSTIS